MKRETQLATQAATREHEHGCADSTDAAHGLGGAALCFGRGYHRCACGATLGLSRKSDWIKSHAVESGSQPWNPFIG